jgi:hypothetical protein
MIKRTRNVLKRKTMKSNKNLEKERKKKKSEIQMHLQTEHEPRAIIMAKGLKEMRKKEQPAKDKDKADEEKEAVIEELESQGDLKENVPVGGEEYEAEEPRQGS